jgi:hypothetical protein
MPPPSMPPPSIALPTLVLPMMALPSSEMPIVALPMPPPWFIHLVICRLCFDHSHEKKKIAGARYVGESLAAAKRRLKVMHLN